MKKSQIVFKAGTRPSSLALTQSRTALDRIETLLDGIVFESVQITSVGDTDRTTDLRESPADFFTRELDDALLRGDIDLAVHSAKDIPDPLPEGLDCFWLPWRGEPRDVLILSKGRKTSALPDNPVIGVSSDRREEYCTKRFPQGIQKNIRGNIEERIAQVDDGTYDIVVMAAAALIRLGIEARITEWISLDDLDVPAGQGYLGITFREGDKKMRALRRRFTQAVRFADGNNAIEPTSKQRIEDSPSQPGALSGQRILLTCSEAIQEKAAALVRNLGGRPVQFPLIQLHCRQSVQLRFDVFDWVVMTSPSSVRALMQWIKDQQIDSCSIPKIMVCGQGTADEVEQYSLRVDAMPASGFSTKSLIELTKEIVNPGEKILRVRSDKSGPRLAEAMRNNGAEVEDIVIYDNERILYDVLPEFEAVFFSSASGVESFMEQWGSEALVGKTISVIGKPTAAALEKHHLQPDLIAREATVPCAIGALAEHIVSQSLNRA